MDTRARAYYSSVYSPVFVSRVTPSSGGGSSYPGIDTRASWILFFFGTDVEEERFWTAQSRKLHRRLLELHFGDASLIEKI